MCPQWEEVVSLHRWRVVGTLNLAYLSASMKVIGGIDRPRELVTTLMARSCWRCFFLAELDTPPPASPLRLAM
ncbi:hypothetical protein VNO78_21531 [Psophocarpus tetragonolobus]|uniref:Uncharacterized protein n=1 Tax=Psophocarpus tetragonolobus TaxID=3891 RepID=A0AAN9SBB6_PSOTE